ncbi:MAG: CotH kinase family protein [Erysipelotrichaceae bacterium]|nr:CotH kinase family protein [Erysipelotrichaceae bacterium]
MGKNKHWVLLANYLDYTLLRDRVTSYLAGNMTFAFTPECVNVEVYMKDVKDDQLYYLGNYMLAEQVRVGENRLEIDELDENETDPIKITGGYLIQEGSQRHLSRDVFKTKLASLTLANDTPSFDTKDEGYENDTQMNYIREHIQHYKVHTVSLRSDTYRKMPSMILSVTAQMTLISSGSMTMASLKD